MYKHSIMLKARAANKHTSNLRVGHFIYLIV